MASFEGESAKVIDKFNGENFNLWKFKMEMVLASMDLWEIVDGSKEAPPSNVDPKVIKEYQRCAKKAMSTIGINLVDSQLHHIKRCKGPVEAWKTLCNIHEMRSLSNIFFIRHKFFRCQMQEWEDLLDHINKVKALVDQLACLEMHVRDEDVVTTLLESLPPSYEYLITALETLPMQDLTMEFCDCTIDAWSVQEEGEGATRWLCGDGVNARKRRDYIYTQRHQDMLLLWQTGPHCTILLQGQKQQQGEGECQQSQGRWWLCLCNKGWRPLQGHMQVNHGLGSHQAYDPS